MNTSVSGFTNHALGSAMFLASVGGTGVEQTITAGERRELAYLMYATLVALFLLIVFLVAVMIVKRFGARLRQAKVGGQQTHYVDAWGQYRLSEDDIARATEEPPRDPPGDEERPA